MDKASDWKKKDLEGMSPSTREGCEESIAEDTRWNLEDMLGGTSDGIIVEDIEAVELGFEMLDAREALFVEIDLRDGEEVDQILDFGFIVLIVFYEMVVDRFSSVDSMVRPRVLPWQCFKACWRLQNPETFQILWQDG